MCRHVCPALGLGVGLLQGDGRNKSELLLSHYHLPQRTQRLGPTAGLSWEGKDAVSTKRKDKDVPDTLLMDFQTADRSVGFGLPLGVKGVDTSPGRSLGSSQEGRSKEVGRPPVWTLPCPLLGTGYLHVGPR